jgi:hypothetical protein
LRGGDHALIDLGSTWDRLGIALGSSRRTRRIAGGSGTKAIAMQRKTIPSRTKRRRCAALGDIAFARRKQAICGVRHGQ